MAENRNNSSGGTGGSGGYGRGGRGPHHHGSGNYHDVFVSQTGQGFRRERGPAGGGGNRSVHRGEYYQAGGRGRGPHGYSNLRPVHVSHDGGSKKPRQYHPTAGAESAAERGASTGRRWGPRFRSCPSIAQRNRTQMANAKGSSTDSQPISVCNFVGKESLKKLAFGLAIVLTILISLSQSGCIEGRRTLEDVLVVQERETEGSDLSVTVKLNLANFCWTPIQNILQLCGFPENFLLDQLLLASVGCEGKELNIIFKLDLVKVHDQVGRVTWSFLQKILQLFGFLEYSPAKELVTTSGRQI